MSEDNNTGPVPQIVDAAQTGQTDSRQQGLQQINQLREEADDLLLQIMLQQQEKLSHMVQQLQSQKRKQQHSSSQPDTSVVPKGDETDERDAVLEDVTDLQTTNMVHLDVVIERINQTMQNSLKMPLADQHNHPEEKDHDSTGTDV
ncbi:hypothetical protein [Gynuella sp.]|uniref:hypothetical protein n=1 Tax=Gynuella sp. TaxID=2969146 RepID=UPI003D0CD7D8